MYITSERQISVSRLDATSLVIHIAKDEKSFYVMKHQNFKEAEGQDYHISELAHILLAGKK